MPLARPRSRRSRWWGLPCLAAALAALAACGGTSEPAVELTPAPSVAPLGSSEPPPPTVSPSLAGDLKACTEQERTREPGQGAADPGRDLYDKALAHEREGALDQARRAYFELIQQHPGSTYVPHAYFAFGLLFEREAESDPTKAELAAQSYEEVLKYSASPFTLIARVRLATVLAKVRPQRSAVALGQVLAAKGADAPCGEQARAEADRMLAELKR